MNIQNEIKNERQIITRKNSKECAQDLFELLQKQISCDFLLIVGKCEKEFPCHKLILYARSKFFREKIKQNPNIEKFILADFEVPIIEILLKYIYSGEVTIVHGSELELLKASIRLGLDECADVIRGYLGKFIDPMDACTIIDEAKKNNHTQLFLTCVEHFEKNAEEVLKTGVFGKWSKETITHILKYGKPNITELQIFQFTSRWAKKQSKIQKKSTVAIFREVERYIRYGLIDPVSLMEQVEPLGLVSDKYLMEAYKYHCLPESHKSKIHSFRCKMRGVFSNFEFNTKNLPKDVRLSNNNCTATLEASDSCATILANLNIQKGGFYYWEIRIDRSKNPKRAQIMIGVRDPTTVNHESFLSNDEKGYSLYAYNGYKHHDATSMRYGEGPFSTGSKVGVLIDFRDPAKGELYFFLNGKSLGM